MAGDPGAAPRAVGAAYGCMALWIVLSAGVIMLNKYILDPRLGGFPFPLTLTGLHMAFCWAASAALVRGGVVDAPDMPSETYLRCVVPIGALFACVLWLGNAAYVHLSVSFIQMLKAMMPLLVYAVGTVLGTERWSARTGCVLAVVVAGVMAASFGAARPRAGGGGAARAALPGAAHHAARRAPRRRAAAGEVVLSLAGLALQCGSMAAEAVRLTLVQLLLQARGIKLNPITTMFHVCPVCLACLLLPFAALEARRLAAHHAARAWRVGPGLLLASAGSALALNCAIFMLIGRTSALTMNLAGVAKDVLLIYLSMVLYGSVVTELQLLGYAVALGGAFTYNYQKLAAQAAAAKAAAASDRGAGGGGGEGGPSGAGERDALLARPAGGSPRAAQAPHATHRPRSRASLRSWPRPRSLRAPGAAMAGAPSDATMPRRRATVAGEPREAALRAASGDGSGIARRRRGAARSSAPGLGQRSVSFSDLPDFLKDNEYIVGSYRPEQSIRGSVRSLFSLHNETGNVWTHFLGFLLFVALAWYFAAHPPTPLAVTAEHVEGLLAELSHSVGARVHALEERLHLGDRVHALEERLGQRVHALEERLHLGDRVHALADGVQGNLHAVGAAVGQRLHTLQDGLAAAEARLHSRAAGLGVGLRAALRAQLAPIVQWPVPRWPVYVYFAGACVCLLTSGTCHLLGCCARHISEMVWRFDYAGIAVLIVASFVPAMYYAFLCNAFWRNFYLATTVSMGVVVVALSLPSCFQARHYRAARAGLFTMLGAWGVVPVTHLLLTSGHVWAIRAAFQLDIFMGAIYLAGAAIYATRVPERWYPGRFDILGHSHQLWHAAVVAAALVHYRAILILLQWRDASGGCAAPGRVNGPLADVLAAAAAAGQAPLPGIDAVWDTLESRLAQQLAAAAAAGAAL
ncbi:ADIPOR3 [Scenedesmus sp. PABB004]|nr:ADIPOR3 [Scenedesmus sp. PABB004]